MDFDYTALAIPVVVLIGALYFYFFVWKKETEFKPVPQEAPINDDSKPIDKSKFY